MRAFKTFAARFAITAVISMPFLIAYGFHSAAAKLDRATRAQCAAQDWPVSQHTAHLEFCRTYLAANP